MFGHVARLGKNTPSTSDSSVPDRHLSWTSSWSHLETSPRSLKKQVAWSDSLWQQPPTRWSMEMCYPSKSFCGDATVPADYALTTKTTTQFTTDFSTSVPQAPQNRCYRSAHVVAFTKSKPVSSLSHYRSRSGAELWRDRLLSKPQLCDRLRVRESSA